MCSIKFDQKFFKSHDPHLFAVTVAIVVVVGGVGDVIIIIAFLLSFLSLNVLNNSGLFPFYRSPRIFDDDIGIYLIHKERKRVEN